MHVAADCDASVQIVSKAIPALDLLFYLTETEVSPMHVGLLLVE